MMLSNKHFIRLSLLLLMLFLMTATHKKAASPYTPPSYVTIKMYRLVSPEDAEENPLLRVGEIHPSNSLCAAQSTVYGCTAFVGDDDYPYPYDSNPALVPIETDYLLDVVSQEMGTARFHPHARHAQAIVARSYAYHREHFDSNTRTPTMDNSTASQVFVPYRFERWGQYFNFSPNPNNPCYTYTHELFTEQKVICDAVNASKNYVTGVNNIYDLPDTPIFDTNAPAFTMYFADTYNYAPTATLTEPSIVPGTTPPRYVYPYLVGVVDSVSSDPNVPTSGHRYGLSQKGASRWAYGNTGWQGNLERWPVQWNSVEQILVHYYTNIQIRDGKGNVVFPNDRWNLLDIGWGASDNQPLNVQHGNSYPITILLQNTGLEDWDCNFPSETYRLTYEWARNGNRQTSIQSVSVCGLDRGEASAPLSLTLDDIPNWGDGSYGLHFNIDSVDGSNRLWSTYTALVCVGNEPCGDVFLPIVTQPESN